MKKTLLLATCLVTLFSCTENRTSELTKEVEELIEQLESEKRTVTALESDLDNCQNGAEKLYNALIQAEKSGNTADVKKYYSSLYAKHSDFKDFEKAKSIYDKVVAKEQAEEAKKEAELKKIEAEKAKAITRLKKNHDDISGVTWYKNPYFTHYNNSNLTSLYMGSRSYGEPWMRLEMSYSGESWIFFDEAYLSFDGRTLEIPFDKYQNKKTDNGYSGVYEWIDVSVTPTMLIFLEEMVESGKGKMRLSGKYTHTRNLSQNEIKAIRDLINGYNYLKNNNK